MVNIGVVGATGQVGQVMRTLLEERDFPTPPVGAVLRLRAFAGQEAAVPRAGDRGRGRRDRRPERPGHRVVLGRRDDVAGAGAAVRRRRRHRHRQFVGVPQGPRRAAGGQRGQLRSGTHTIGRRASSPTRTAPPWPRCRCSRCCTTRRSWCASIASTYQAVSGSGLAGVQELFEQARAVVDDSEQLVHDGSALQFPPPTSTSRRSRSTWCRWPDRSSTTTPVRPTRTRSCATRAARSSAFPTCWSAAPVCGCRCTPATRCRSTPNSPGRCRRIAHASCSTAPPGVKLVDVPTPLAAAGVDESLVGRIRQDPGVPDGRGLALFVSGDNLRKGAALNTIQIAELLAAEL